jgi:hypothetical protein
MRLLNVNGKAWTGEALNDAIRRARRTSAPIDLHAENAGYATNYKLNYNDGPSYPHLVRDEAKPDLLSEILKPLTGAAGQK